MTVEIAIAMQKAGQTGARPDVAIGLLVVALFFVYRSFYGMRIPEDK